MSGCVWARACERVSYMLMPRCDGVISRYTFAHTFTSNWIQRETREWIMPCHFSHSIYYIYIYIRLEKPKEKSDEFKPKFRIRQTLCPLAYTYVFAVAKKIEKNHIVSKWNCARIFLVGYSFFFLLLLVVHFSRHWKPLCMWYTRHAVLYTLSVYQYPLYACLSLATIYRWPEYVCLRVLVRATSNKNRQAHAKREHHRCGREPFIYFQHQIEHTLKVVACHEPCEYNDTITNTLRHHNQFLCWIRFFFSLCYAFMFTSQSQSISSASSYGWYCVCIRWFYSRTACFKFVVDFVAAI